MQEFEIGRVTEKVAERFKKFCLVKKGTITLKQASQELIPLELFVLTGLSLQYLASLRFI